MLLTNTILSCSVFFGVPVPAGVCDLSHLAVGVNEALSGTVKSADLAAKRFTVEVEDGASREVSWNDDTTFLLDGEKSDPKSVLVTMGKIRASLDKEGIATSVSRWSD
jgi:hypothetical protein